MLIRPLFIYLLFASLFLGTFCSKLIRFPLKESELPKDEKSPATTKTNFLAKPASIGIKNFFNRRYQAIIQLGSQGKEFEVILDTGSATLWVADETLTSKMGNTYDCSSSTTCVAEKSTRRGIIYGTGSMSGYKVTDTLKLGAIDLPNFSFLLADKVDDKITGIQGILGLSLGRDRIGFPTTLERLKQSNLIDTGSFSMYLGDDSYSYGGRTGEIIFGGYDPKYALEDFRFVKVRSAQETIFWAADMRGLGFGSKANVTSTLTTPVIFDSGTSFLLLAEDHIQSLISSANAQGIIITKNYITKHYEFDCSEKSRMPTLHFYFDGAAFDIPGSSYVDSQGGSCYLMMESLGTTASRSKPVVLGDVFLKNYYALYTADNSTVGFARAAPVKGNPLFYIFLLLVALIGLVVLGMHIHEKNKTKPKSVFSSSKGITIGGSSSNSGRNRLLELNSNAGPYSQL